MSESQTPRIRMNDLLVKSNKQDLTPEEEMELKILTLQSELAAASARLAELEGIIQDFCAYDPQSVFCNIYTTYKEGKK